MRAAVHASLTCTPELARAAGPVTIPIRSACDLPDERSARAACDEVKGRAKSGDVEASANEWALLPISTRILASCRL